MQKQEKQVKAGVKQVANYGNYIYNIKYLADRYGIKRQTVQQCYIDKYRSTLNADQVHILKIGKEWRLDTEAVNMLDGIVGYVGDKVAVPDYESPEMVKIRELEAEVERLTRENTEVRTENQGLILINGSQDKTIDEIRAEKEEYKLLTSNAEAEKQANLDRAMSAEAEVARFKNMSRWERFKFLIAGKE